MADEEKLKQETSLDAFAFLLNRRAERGWYAGRSDALIQACLDGRMAAWTKEDPGAITVDGAKGILFHRRALHAHLPYHVLPDDTDSQLIFKTLLGDIAYSQLDEKRRGVSADTGPMDENLACQLSESGFTANTDSPKDIIASAILSDPERVGEILGRGVPISESSVRFVLTDYASELSVAQKAERVLKVAELAAQSPASVSDRISFNDVEKSLATTRYASTIPPILNAVMNVALPALESEGVRVSRGTFRKGAEGVLFWGKGVISRHFILPQQHFSRDNAAFSSLEVLERQELLALDRLNQTYKQFIDAHRVISSALETSKSQGIPHRSPELNRAIREIEIIVGSELPDRFMELHSMSSSLTSADDSQTSGDQLASTYLALLTKVRADYDQRMSAQNGKELLLRAYPEIHRAFLELGPNFLAGMPASFRDERDQNGNPTRYSPEIVTMLSESPIVIAVAHARESDLPLAKVLTAMNAIGIKPDRPLISIETGSAFLTDPDELRATEMAAREVIRFADDNPSNVAISDTQSGGGGKVAKEVLLAQQRAAEGGRECGVRAYAIAPAKETYVPLPDVFYSQYEETPDGARKLIDMYACNPAPLFLTNQAANWEETDKNTIYFKQSTRERSMNAAISGGYREGQTPIMKGITVAMNGGPRVVMKLNIDTSLGGSLVLVRGTGRFADLGAAITEAALVNGTNTWADLSYDEIITRAKSLIQSVPSFTRPQLERDLDASRGDLGCQQVVQFVRQLGSVPVYITDSEGVYALLSRLRQTTT